MKLKLFLNSTIHNIFYTEADSHIFNHKGGLQIATNNIQSQYSNTIQDSFVSEPRENYMMTGQDSFRNINLNQNHWVPTDHRWSLQQPIVPPEYDNTIPINNNQEIAISQQIQKNNQRNQQAPPEWAVRPELQVEMENSIDKQNSKIPAKTVLTSTQDDSPSIEETEYDEDVKTTEAPKKKLKIHKNKNSKIQKPEEKHIQPTHEQLKLISNDLEIEFVDHDGPAEKPGGAVLSLTLGIIVTAALAILVGCRMRSVGRRIRRNGKSQYAHDADFLVNGMYL